MASQKIYDVIVIGAGQAGIAAGYFLLQTKLSFVLLDKSSYVGQVWNERYDNLRLFTPNAFNSLFGLGFPGKQNAYATKDQVKTYLQDYVKKFSLPVHLQIKVLKLEKTNSNFKIITSKGIYETKNVIVATGQFQIPYIPSYTSNLDRSIFQIHSSSYKNPAQIPKGKILVVGLGNSGAQIAVELAKTHQVTIASRSKPAYLSYTFLEGNWFWLLKKLSLFILNLSTTIWPINKWITNFREPIIGPDGVKLKQLFQNGKIQLKTGVKGAKGIYIQFTDNTQEQYKTVIWATGFREDFSWINIQGSIDIHKKPIQKKGISPIEGLYFVGLKYQTTFSSGFIHGASNDARVVIKELQKNM